MSLWFMQNVLITGGAGFVGSNLSQYLLSQDPNLRVTILGNLSSEEKGERLVEFLKAQFGERVNLVKADIADEEQVKAVFAENNQFDTVLHFAVADYRASSRDPKRADEVNRQGTINLYSEAREHGVTTFFHQSSCMVYGPHKRGEPLFTPESPLNPKGPYGTSKAAADEYIEAQTKAEGLNMRTFIVRPPNLFGPKQIPHAAPLAFMRACLLGNDIRISGDGQQIREFMYITDFCEAAQLLLERGKHGKIYNLVGNESITMLGLAQLIKEITPPTNNEILLEESTAPDLEDDGYRMDGSLMRELGWKPKVSLREGLEKFRDWCNGRGLPELIEEETLCSLIRKADIMGEGNLVLSSLVLPGRRK